jgi:hypothetical protein
MAMADISGEFSLALLAIIVIATRLQTRSQYIVTSITSGYNID